MESEARDGELKCVDVGETQDRLGGHVRRITRRHDRDRRPIGEFDCIRDSNGKPLARGGSGLDAILEISLDERERVVERARLNADHRHADLGVVAGIAEDQRGCVGAGDARISGAKVRGERDGVAAPHDGVAGRHDDFEVERNRGTIPRERDAAQLFARSRNARGQRECCRQGQRGSRRDSDEGPEGKRLLKLEVARSRLCVAGQGVEQFRSDVEFVAQFDDAEQAFAEFGEVRFESPGDRERGDFVVPRFQDESPRGDAQDCQPRHFKNTA